MQNVQSTLAEKKSLLQAVNQAELASSRPSSRNWTVMSLCGSKVARIRIPSPSMTNVARSKVSLIEVAGSARPDTQFGGSEVASYLPIATMREAQLPRKENYYGAYINDAICEYG